jgi:hypothetical protein
MEFMAINCVLQGGLRKSFIAALLVTGSVKRAEAAVFESISRLHPDDASGKALLWGAVEASIPSGGEVMESQPDELDGALSILPFELQCVLYLAADLRYCFVCRVLVDLPREVCATLLHLEPCELDERTCTAVQRLANIAGNKAVGRKNAQKEQPAACNWYAVLSKSEPWQ